ncbi:MAG: hypothetical protein Q9159_002283 [Coniocarpon cinnabarinum]
MPLPPTSAGVSITDPLVLYRSLLSTNRIRPDPAQHRLALHFQTLYHRLKDYEPIAQYGSKLQQLQKTLGSTPANPAPGTDHDVPRQGIFSSFFEDRTGSSTSSSLALTKVLTSHEEAMKIDSPKGLLLHGEVGTGKSMLVDLFAECLPTRKKRRWHYNTFMLEILAKLERLRRSRELIVPASLGQQEDYSLLWLARELISTSPILFLDELQLPDRAAAKILTNLMTCFFQLGGVLVATSNRMPEELDKAARMHFAPPVSNIGLKSLGVRLTGVQQSRRSEFADFLDLLSARCDVWQMEGTKDYRRMDAAQDSRREEWPASGREDIKSPDSGFDPTTVGNLGLGWEQSRPSNTNRVDVALDAETHSIQTPKHYHLSDDSSSELLVSKALNKPVNAVDWSSQLLSVYGRPLRVPRTCEGVTLFKFDEICSNALGPTAVLGPADYTTLASHFHTFIVTDVPTLSLLQKNEARRLITLLDALYEAKCKLAVSAKASPDYLFFPETILPRQDPNRPDSVDEDATYSETLSEIYQDTTAPFRPNVSTYADANPGATSPEEADATHARFAGLFDEDRAEQQRELSRRHDAPNVDTGDARLIGRRTQAPDTSASMTADTESGPIISPHDNSHGPDFSRPGAFTGEDEKFAFKRAQSRLWELCSGRWWDREHDHTQDGDPIYKPSWWQPLSSEIRIWEQPRDLLAREHPADMATMSASLHEGPGAATSIDENKDSVLFKHGATSPFRTSKDPPPQFNWTHAWGMMRWGKKAGQWGQGTDAFKEQSNVTKDGHAGEPSDECISRRRAWRQKDPGGGSKIG